MSTVKNYILKQVADKNLSQEDAKQFLLELANQSAAKDGDKSIAIIGMSGRFPKADNVEQFWERLRDGINCIDEYPESRSRDIEAVLRNPYYTEFLTGAAIDPKHFDDLFARAGYMKEADKFDAAFFGIPPNEATYMDPNQRLSLEVAWEAMEDGGYGGENLFGSNTGVFVGREGTNVAFYRFNSKKDPMQLTGSWESIIASRISYLFDLRGPSMLVDTACSGSLVSVHMACKSILSGECDMALAGGVNLVHGELKSQYQGGMNMSSVESEDNVIRTFDADANGTVWGEGVAMVLLKPLKKALADGDPIHAVIKGSAINNDGASTALTAPNAETQEEVIVKAWKDAGINPETLSYMEAHGTGTVLGDPIEFKALTNAFRRFTDKSQFCGIGSLKTNIGHLVASSGIASLLKVVKSLQSQEIAPTINFNKPNPYINFPASPLYIADRRQQWNTAEDTPRRAGISSFGFNHTNCHMVLEEAPERVTQSEHAPQYCLTISAKKQELLSDYVQRYQDYCRGDQWNLADLCYTAAIGRGHYNYRLCVVAENEQQLRERLNKGLAVIEGQSAEGVSYGGFNVVSEKKTQRLAGDITEREKKAFTDHAGDILSAYRVTKDQNQLQKLAQLYCQGADVNWGSCYENEKRARLSQPVYPLERKRFWADPKITQVEGYSGKIHPLIDNLVSQEAKEWIYESTFSNEANWVLADHKINGTGVVPGTTYLEMARVAATKSLGIKQMELANIFFLQPMVVEEQEKRTVRVQLNQIGEGEYSFTITSTSKTNADDQWQSHVEGKVKVLNDSVESNTEYLAVQEAADHVIEEYMAEADTGVFQFGPHWDTVRSAWNKDNKALARLTLPQALTDELEDFVIHPSMLDNAMNLTSQNTGHTYLPFMYKSFRLFRPFTPSMYSLVTATTPTTGEEETHNYNVVITDLEGQVIALAEGYVTKKVHSFNFSQSAMGDNDYLQMRWVDLAQPSAAEKPAAPLLFLIQQGQTEGLAEIEKSFADSGIELRKAELCLADGDGANSFNATEQGLNDLMSSPLAQGIDGIVVATSFNTAGSVLDAINPQAFGPQRTLSVDALFHLSKAILANRSKLDWGLALLSSGGYRVNDEAVSNPLAASSAILGMTLAMETAGLQCRVLDVDGAASAESVVSNLVNATPGIMVAQRGDALYQQELGPLTLEEKEPKAFKEDGVYVVSGGLGGLGLAAAAHVSSQLGGKGNVVLLGRSALPEASQWDEYAAKADGSKQASACASLVMLRDQLSHLSYLQVDVTDADQVYSLVADLSNRFGRINGVFHAAGIAGDGFILRKTFETFDSVLKPKLEGTVNFLSALAREDVDFVTLYSSITALTGGEGQSDYAAANAFMDAITPLANSVNVPVNSINWPSWSEVGMSVDFELDTDMTPFTALTTEQAFNKFNTILANDITRVLPADVNPAVLSHFLDNLVFKLSPELEMKFQQAGAASAGGAEEGAAANAEDIQILGKSEDELTESESSLAVVYASVLGISEIDIFTNFQDMGGNSIIATHLLKVIEGHYPGLIDISDIFSYPSVDVMAEYIDEKRGVSQESAGEGASEENNDWDQMMDSLVSGDESVDSILERL